MCSYPGKNVQNLEVWKLGGRPVVRGRCQGEPSSSHHFLIFLTLHLLGNSIFRITVYFLELHIYTSTSIKHSYQWHLAVLCWFLSSDGFLSICGSGVTHPTYELRKEESSNIFGPFEGTVTRLLTSGFLMSQLLRALDNPISNISPVSLIPVITPLPKLTLIACELGYGSGSGRIRTYSFEFLDPDPNTKYVSRC